MTHKTLRWLRLLLGLLLFGAGGGQPGGIDLVVQQIETIGARQWLSLMAGSIVSSAPVSQRIARAFSSLPVPSGEEIAGGHTLVCRKLRPLDLVRESLNVGHDGRADLPVLERGFFTLQVQEPT